MLIASSNLIKGKKIPWTNTLYNQKAMDVLLNMANSLSNDDSLKSYLLQFINKLKFKLGKSLSVPIDTRDICNDYPYPNAILSYKSLPHRRTAGLREWEW